METRRKILDFVARFVRKAYVQGITKAQELNALLYFLTGFAQSQYAAGAEMTSLEKSGVSRWPEAVQYFRGSFV